MHRVTIKDIAEMAGVSYSSVSRAINNTGKISDETREKILAICKREGYRVNNMARNLTRNQTHMIGLIVPTVTNPFYAEISLTVEMHASELGYNIMPCNTLNEDERTEQLIEFLIDQRVDGIILASNQDSVLGLMRKYSSYLPMVMIGEPSSRTDTSEFNVVTVNNYIGGRIAADYLTGLGHTKIAYVGYRIGNHSQESRYQGFQEFLADRGIVPMMIQNRANHSSIESGYTCGKELFESGQRPTAVFASTDFVALGVIKAADEYGIRIPEDMSLIGFDNVIYSSLPKISLTTIDHKKKELATAAVDTIVRAISAPDLNEFVHRTILPTLVERTSCRRCPVDPDGSR